MKIKSLTDCYTIDPSIKWSAGEVIEVDDEVANKLLKNKNFVADVSSGSYKTREMTANKVSKK